MKPQQQQMLVTIYELDATRTQTLLMQVNERHAAAMQEVRTKTQRLQVLDAELAYIFIALQNLEKEGCNPEDLIIMRNRIKWLGHDRTSAQEAIATAQLAADKVLKELDRARAAHRVASERLKNAQEVLRRAVVRQQVRRDTRVEEEVLEARATVSQARSAT